MKGQGLLVRAAVLACCGSILSCVGVQAEDVVTDYDLGTVVVTATKTEQTIANVPASVSVITSQDIADKNKEYFVGSRSFTVFAGYFY